MLWLHRPSSSPFAFQKLFTYTFKKRCRSFSRDEVSDTLEGISINKVASSGIPVYRATNLQMERRGDFRVVKIEAELILEANRLQLMKQDLEKAECLLEQFHFEEVEDVTWCYGCNSWRSKWQE
ncbi:hypothetical protein TNCV_2773611 [Trichonephila clavipes]|nr:hypothetical protein TNCV_2773611 [Trichonephila clavipes]